MKRSVSKGFSPPTIKPIAKKCPVGITLVPVNGSSSIPNMFTGLRMRERASFGSVGTLVWAKVCLLRSF